MCILFTLSACVDSKTREDIISTMEKAEIIEEDWEYLYYLTQDASPIPDIMYYDYVYQDGEKLYAIRIHNKTKDGTYLVELGKNVEISETIYERTQEEDVVDKKVTNFETVSTYRLQYKTLLMKKVMFIKEEN